LWDSKSGQCCPPYGSRPLDINVQPELPLLQADYILIEQVLINLLDNALKYSEQDSKIVVSTQQSRPKHIITEPGVGYRLL